MVGQFLHWWGCVDLLRCPLPLSLLQFLVAPSGCTSLQDHCLHVLPSRGSMLQLPTLVYASLWEIITGMSPTLQVPVCPVLCHYITMMLYPLPQCQCSAQADNDHQCPPWWCVGAGTRGGASVKQWFPVCQCHYAGAGGNTWVVKGGGGMWLCR